MRRARHSTTLLLLVASVVPVAAQQLDAKNWGQGTPGVELGVHEGTRQRTSKGTILCTTSSAKDFLMALFTRFGTGSRTSRPSLLSKESVSTSVVCWSAPGNLVIAPAMGRTIPLTSRPLPLWAK